MQNVCEAFLLSPWICVTYSLAYPYLDGCAKNRRSTPVGAVKILLGLQAALLGEPKGSFVATDAYFASAL